MIVRDAGTWEEKATFELTGFHGQLSISADGGRVACASGEAGKAVVQVFDVGTRKEAFNNPMSGVYETVALSADGKTVGVSGGGAKGEFALFNVDTGKEKAVYAGKGRFAVSADAAAVAEWDFTEAGMTVNVWEGTAKTPQAIKAKQFKPFAVAFLDGGKHLAVAGHTFAKPEGEAVRVYSLKTLAEVDSFVVGKETNLSSAFYLAATPDSARLLTFGVDKYLRVWSTPFGEKKDEKK